MNDLTKEENNHDEQRELIKKSIEHLKIAHSYLVNAESYCNKSVNALLADYDSKDIQTLIKNANETLNQIGQPWEIVNSIN